jgi:hypothetical protein
LIQIEGQNGNKRYHDRPIFVFGYSQMMRGLSYRSKLRVPSHVVIFFRESMSMCKLVQAAGRSNGEQRSVLKKNGFEHVTILTSYEDFQTIHKYPEFLDIIKKRMQESNQTLGGVLKNGPLQQKWPARFSFASPNGWGRLVGQKKVGLAGVQETSCILDKNKFSRSTIEETEEGSKRDRELFGTPSHDRAVLDVLHLARDEKLSMTSRKIQLELATGSHDGYGPEEGKSSTLKTADVTAILKKHCKPMPHRDAILIAERVGVRNVQYFINEIGWDGIEDSLFEPAAGVDDDDSDDDDGDQLPPPQRHVEASSSSSPSSGQKRKQTKGADDGMPSPRQPRTPSTFTSAAGGGVCDDGSDQESSRSSCHGNKRRKA